MNEVIDINPNDRLLLFGYGLFETLKVNPQGIEVPQLHWERMCRGGELLGLKVPDFPSWQQAINEFLVSIKHDNNFDNNVDSISAGSFALRVTLSGGATSGNPSIESNSPKMLFNTRSITYTSSQYEEGVELFVLPSPRNEYSILTKIKSANYLENILAREEAQRQGAFDGLWLNTKGHLVEATMSNLFFVKDGILYTPALNCGCLPGTRRNLLLQLASALGITVAQGEYKPEDLFEADEVFLTNALMGIMPVRKINEQIFKVPHDSSNTITAKLVRHYKEYLNK